MIITTFILLFFNRSFGSFPAKEGDEAHSMSLPNRKELFVNCLFYALSMTPGYLGLTLLATVKKVNQELVRAILRRT